MTFKPVVEPGLLSLVFRHGFQSSHMSSLFHVCQSKQSSLSRSTGIAFNEALIL